MREDDEHHVAVLPAGADGSRQWEVAQVAHEVFGREGRAVAAVVAGHAGAVRGGVFEGGVRCCVGGGEDEVGAEEVGDRGCPL